MSRRDRQEEPLAGGRSVEPLGPDGVIVPLRPPGDAASEARLERGGARRAVTAEAQRHHPNAARIELATAGAVLVRRRGIALRLGDERQVADARAPVVAGAAAEQAAQHARG